MIAHKKQITEKILSLPILPLIINNLILVLLIFLIIEITYKPMLLMK